MSLISSEERNKLFVSFERDAFHLELRDSYHVEDEDESFVAWRNGLPEDEAPFEPWLELMRAATAGSRTVRRVRVVTEPLSEYLRYEYDGTHLNQKAGEDIRWLPRHLVPEGTVWPVDGNDWWLFDDRLLAVGHFHDDGRVAGSELITEPQVVAECVQLRDRLWTMATPHDTYRPR